MSFRLAHLLRHGQTAPTGRPAGRTDCAVSGEGIAARIDQIVGLAP